MFVLINNNLRYQTTETFCLITLERGNNLFGIKNLIKLNITSGPRGERSVPSSGLSTIWDVLTLKSIESVDG